MHSKRQYPKKACANPACGSIYIPHDRRQLYCSTQCRINAANDRRYIANNTRFKDEKQTRKNNKILELIWKKLEREKQKLVSKEVLELERFKFDSHAMINQNSKTKKNIFWFHDYGLESIDTANALYEIHKKSF